MYLCSSVSQQAINVYCCTLFYSITASTYSTRFDYNCSDADSWKIAFAVHFPANSSNEFSFKRFWLYFCIMACFSLRIYIIYSSLLSSSARYLPSLVPFHPSKKTAQILALFCRRSSSDLLSAYGSASWRICSWRLYKSFNFPGLNTLEHFYSPPQRVACRAHAKAHPILKPLRRIDNFTSPQNYLSSFHAYDDGTRNVSIELIVYKWARKYS